MEQAGGEKIAMRLYLRSTNKAVSREVDRNNQVFITKGADGVMGVAGILWKCNETRLENEIFKAQAALVHSP